MKLIDLWRRPIWVGSYPTLIHHLLHFAAPMAIVGILTAIGVGRLDAHAAVTTIFIAVELITGALEENWADSAYDAYQYQAHWLLYMVAVGVNPVITIAVLVSYLLLYGVFGTLYEESL